MSAILGVTLSWTPESVRIIAVLIGAILGYIFGQRSARDSSARKVVAEKVDNFLDAWGEFVRHLAIHQSGVPIEVYPNLGESRKKLSRDLINLKENRIRLKNLLKKREAKKLDDEFQKWFSLSTGDKGIISNKKYAFDFAESEEARKAANGFSCSLVHRQLKILKGKVGLRF